AEVPCVPKFGFCQVTVTFEDGPDIYLARQVVTERLQTIDLLPGISRPALGPVATGLGEVFHYLVRGEGKSLTDPRPDPVPAGRRSTRGAVRSARSRSSLIPSSSCASTCRCRTLPARSSRTT